MVDKTILYVYCFSRLRDFIVLHLVGGGMAQSVQRLGYGMNGRGIGVLFPARGRDFLLNDAQTGSVAHPAFFAMGTGGRFPGIMRQEREANYSPPSRGKVKNGGAIFPLPHTSSCCGKKVKLSL
jgi:hypothetical protein